LTGSIIEIPDARFPDHKDFADMPTPGVHRANTDSGDNMPKVFRGDAAGIFTGEDMEILRDIGGLEPQLPVDPVEITEGVPQEVDFSSIKLG
jgi:hypothetical protein